MLLNRPTSNWLESNSPSLHQTQDGSGSPIRDDGGMKIFVLDVPDCPNVTALLDDLRAVVGDATTISLETQVIETVQEAQEYGFKGSPTILVDGTDPFDDGTGQVGLAVGST